MNSNERHVTLGLIIAIIVILLIMAFIWGYPYFTGGRYYRTSERNYPVIEDRSYRSYDRSGSTGSSYEYTSSSSSQTTTTTTTEVPVVLP